MGRALRGWCPGALRPMESGDGLVVRIRPYGARLLPDQARAIADLAEAHGAGLIELGSRAHLQLRGVGPGSLPAIHAALSAQGLLDPDPEAEARRNILTTPLWQGPETPALVAALERALASAPPLPPKFGFAVDTGAAAVLGGASADIRIERAARGLILRADGMAGGSPITAAEAPARAVALAWWFARNRAARGGGQGETRMARLVAAGIRPPAMGAEPPLTGPPPVPGVTALGLCLALPFGQISAAGLRALAVVPLRLTPWRSVLLEGEGAQAPGLSGLIADAGDPLLRVAACTGAPGCASASVATRDLARRLAPMVPPGELLHVAGCAKGCAHPRPAGVTLTGRAGRFDLIVNGAAADPPLVRDLTPDQLSDFLRGHFAP